MLFAIAEAALIASSLSLDAFAAGFAYGSSKTKIPFVSVQIINLISSFLTGIALFIGAALLPYIPKGVTLVISFSILFVIGLSKLLDSVTKAIIRRYNGISKRLTGSFLNFSFVLNLYTNPEEADVDASKIISPGEAALLALSLSLDGIAVGFGAAFVGINGVALFVWSLITNAVFLKLGLLIGQKASQINISWLGGAILIWMAITKLF